MIKLKRTSFSIITIATLLSSQVLYALAFNDRLNSTLSPTSNITTRSIKQAFNTKISILEKADKSLYKADFNQLKQRESLAIQAIKEFSNEREITGSPIKTSLRKNGEFKTETETFSFDISGWPGTNTERDSENLFFRSGGIIVYNLWLETEVKAFLPSPSNNPAIIVPMQSSHTPLVDLHDQHLYQLWTASLLMGMQLLGNEQFQDKDIAIAGIGNGIDTILSLQLGASKTYLFDYNERLKDMFLTTLPYNTITSPGIVNTKNIGKSFYDLSEYSPLNVDMIIANLPALGLQFFSEFLQFFKPKQGSIMMIISGANYSMLDEKARSILSVLEKFKKSSEAIKIDYDDGEIKINDDPITYIYEFDSEVWTSQEMLDAVLEAEKEKPAQPKTKIISSPVNTSDTILQSI